MSMKLADLVEKIKQETDIAKVGMIVCHNGVVRGTTRDGIQAEYLEISVDASAMHKVQWMPPRCTRCSKICAGNPA